ncbi:UNVERIFIED_ORG: DNA-binding CsgD family transcriptional regulator [Arthrobacter globiformis]|nr:DNA-binding CsgD family transcriptional regulator [Arthrobacter globiformis]
MARNDAQYRAWLELLGEILQQPLGMSQQFEGQVLDLLGQSFDGACSTRNQVVLPWDDHVLICRPQGYMPDQPPGDYSMRQQPLLRWYVLTKQTDPQTLGRVPDSLAGSRLRRAWQEVVRPWGLNHQLSIPLQTGGGEHHAYLVYRPDLEFTEQELALAKLLQPVLTGLAIHFGAASNCEAHLDGSSFGLTAREMTILNLLSTGLTAEGLGRRLNISPRTAGKHLEHIYRKLDVCDRLMAVQRAHVLGLLAPASARFNSKHPAH